MARPSPAVGFAGCVGAHPLLKWLAMREISSLTLVVNDNCNFSCPYCRQRHGKNTLKIHDVTAFLDFLRPRMAEEVWLGFYGGEPLMSWPLIEKAVAYAENKSARKFRFALTTNGSLVKREHILFFKKHRFDLLLSYDGLAQRDRDVGSIAQVESALAGLQDLFPEGYAINSVFSPKTVRLLAASMADMLQRGHRRLQYSLNVCVPWRDADLAALEGELEKLAAICRSHRQKTGKMPLEGLASAAGRGIFACAAGRDRLALLPDRTVWGCYLFYDLLGHAPLDPDYSKYCYGKLEPFMSAPAPALAVVAANYAELRQDYFFSEKKELCSLCDDLEQCSLCPLIAALATGTLAVFPSWTCELKKIGRRFQDRLAATAGPRGRK